MRQVPNGPAMTLNIPDYLAYDNANALALRIIHYWNARGYSPDVAVVPLNLGGKYASRQHYGIRSNMVGGRPCPTV